MSATRSRWGGVLRAVLAIALLVLVGFNVPWNDRATWTNDTDELAASGTIEGNWRSDAVGFRFAPDAELDTDWPEDARAAQRGATPFELKRSPPAAGKQLGYSWRPGLIRVFREMDPKGLMAALGLLLFSAVVAITRWSRLLRIAGCPARWYDALRLTFVGFFMNLVLPGLTGGDLVKAVLVVRENPERRADALVSVVVDRGIGLLVLMGMAVAVVLLEGDKFRELRWPVVLVFVGVVVALWLALHPWPRATLKVDKLLDRLPQRARLRSIDRALSIYMQHPGEMTIAVALSVLNHASIATALMFLGHAFGDTLGWAEYLGIAAIANTVSSIPIAPGGWGVGEALYGYLFHLLGAPTALGIAVSVSYRLLNTALGLAGGVFLLPWVPGARDVRAELKTTEDVPG